jgi:hypothetical protein
MTAGKTGRFAAMATFGQRGVEAGPSTTFNQVSQVMPAAGAAEAEERGGLLSSFLKPSEDHLDIDFGVREDYAPGKTLWIAVPLWFFFGGWALHRFYLGHWKYALVLSLAGAMAGFALFMGLASAGAVYAETKTRCNGAQVFRQVAADADYLRPLGVSRRRLHDHPNVAEQAIGGSFFVTAPVP